MYCYYAPNILQIDSMNVYTIVVLIKFFSLDCLYCGEYLVRRSVVVVVVAVLGFNIFKAHLFTLHAVQCIRVNNVRVGDNYG